MENKPTPEPKPEEILKKHCKNERGHWIGLTKEGVLQAMQEYADLYHKEKLRGELIKFAKDNQGCFIVSPTLCVDEYLKTKE